MEFYRTNTPKRIKTNSLKIYVNTINITKIPAKLSITDIALELSKNSNENGQTKVKGITHYNSMVKN